jgi:hypothetical protein
LPASTHALLAQDENVRRKQAEIKRKVGEEAAAQGDGKRQKQWWEQPQERREGEDEDEEDDVDWYQKEVRGKQEGGIAVQPSSTILRTASTNRHLGRLS